MERQAARGLVARAHLFEVVVDARLGTRRTGVVLEVGRAGDDVRGLVAQLHLDRTTRSYAVHLRHVQVLQAKRTTET